MLEIEKGVSFSSRVVMNNVDVITEDMRLLREYVRRRSDKAFEALLARHVNLVYSAALRQVRSLQLAEEVSQSVFSDLAQNAPKLRPGTILTAWLYHWPSRFPVRRLRVWRQVGFSLF